MNMLQTAKSWVQRLVQKQKAKAWPDGSDWTRWQVESEKDPEKEYLVDLLDFPLEGDVNGSCTCEHFTFNMKPYLDRGYNQGLPLRCKHIRKARAILVGALLGKELERRNPGRKRNR
jgi:hypothetical protein